MNGIGTSSVVIVNDNVAGNNSTIEAGTMDLVHSNEIVPTVACHPDYSEVPKRYASFTNWSSEASPTIDEFVRAGFFYTGSKNIVTCFYCGGSLQNWGVNDNPMVEHTRCFSNCGYAKKLCGDELYRTIQESNRTLQELKREAAKNASNLRENSLTLQIPDEATLSRLVAARLDLPVSQRLLDQNFKLSVIKRCWEDQLRLKRNDFVSDSDLFVACLILQNQIEYINGKKENIKIPSIEIRKIHEIQQQQRSGNSDTSSSAAASSNSSDVEMVDISSSSTFRKTTEASVPKIIQEADSINTSSTNQVPQPKPPLDPTIPNACIVCHREEKRLACIPCGHLVTCTSCGNSIRSCPICRREIEAFVRIYI
ncbi:unnamed protein product [Rotaria sordida]|uniref:RING-type domain-containing protein n=1 Tax=Rotaria sordida TaxID=392033 RepID=A0A814X5Z4_9BILA|nr:unnamed protein product [Rotaria sordida]